MSHISCARCNIIWAMEWKEAKCWSSASLGMCCLCSYSKRQKIKAWSSYGEVHIHWISRGLYIRNRVGLKGATRPQWALEGKTRGNSMYSDEFQLGSAQRVLKEMRALTTKWVRQQWLSCSKMWTRYIEFKWTRWSLLAWPLYTYYIVNKYKWWLSIPWDSVECLVIRTKYKTNGWCRDTSKA